jgi:DNA-binding transcriptional LysR family regulator
MVRHDLLTLQLFTAVAECGNIAQASTLHNIAASAVSKRIADLEYGMGVPLLYRRHRGVALTPAGEVLLRHARAIAHMAERMSADMSEFASGVRGHVRIAANISAIAQFLPDDLASFVNANPDVRIELREENSDTILGLVREGLADLGIYNGSCPPTIWKPCPTGGTGLWSSRLAVTRWMARIRSISPVCSTMIWSVCKPAVRCKRCSGRRPPSLGAPSACGWRR